jgi:type IV secretory pathway component VirB8
MAIFNDKLNKKNEYAQTDFYHASSEWAYDLYQSQTMWLRRALLELVMLVFLLTLSLLANLFLFPLKEKAPYLYAFDHASGEITKIGTLEPTTLAANWELTRYLLIHYVMNYESYDTDNIDHPYQLVWAQSADNVQKQYDEEVGSNNSYSPYQLYGKDKFITVLVTAINRLNDNTVEIKFNKILHDRTAHTEKQIQQEAILKWEYSKAQTTQKMLDRDPLGFKVTYYQVSQVNVDNT